MKRDRWNKIWEKRKREICRGDSPLYTKWEIGFLTHSVKFTAFAVELINGDNEDNAWKRNRILFGWKRKQILVRQYCIEYTNGRTKNEMCRRRRQLMPLSHCWRFALYLCHMGVFICACDVFMRRVSSKQCMWATQRHYQRRIVAAEYNNIDIYISQLPVTQLTIIAAVCTILAYLRIFKLCVGFRLVLNSLNFSDELLVYTAG